MSSNRSTSKRLTAEAVFFQKNRHPFPFQYACWQHIKDGKSGLLNAPTGSGKTYALLGGILDSYLTDNSHGLKILWVTPLRALAKDICDALQTFCQEAGFEWTVALRTGDTTATDKKNQKSKPPDALVITPESLHVLLCQSDYPYFLKQVRFIVADEWHELLGTKRGVQLELAISRIIGIAAQSPQIWGISATIGNLNEAMVALLGHRQGILVKAEITKEIKVQSIIPPSVETFPWSGHLGLQLIDAIKTIVDQSLTTLLFTNTRSQCELWYQVLLDHFPEWAGIMAMHHGSIDQKIRLWVEEMLGQGKLKLVVCTSSLDLGVDFRPVDTVIQIGGPKGVARFVQRAGRSGHQPGATSQIFFVPTHALELIEGAALRSAIEKNNMERRKPLSLSIDVLSQYLVTLAVGGGFKSAIIFEEVKKTHCYSDLTPETWNWVLNFITQGGEGLQAYDEFAKVYENEGLYKIMNNKMALRHRLSIGTIVADPMMKVHFISGGMIGLLEENFVSKLNAGDTFWFSGRNLEFIRIKDQTVLVKMSTKGKGITPQWMGGRLPLSSQLSQEIQQKFEDAIDGKFDDPEMIALKPLLMLQQHLSMIPDKNTLLIEKTTSKFGHHVFFFPFEGRFVHEVISALIAYRISLITPVTFSIGINDYGFELVSDEEIKPETFLELDIFSVKNVTEDIMQAINMAEMAQRKFRDIAQIAGLTFSGYPGRPVSNRHLQASSGIIYKALATYDTSNLLLKQAEREVWSLQMEQSRLMEALEKINQKVIVLKYTEKITPLAFPIMTEILRQQLTSEQWSTRMMKLQMQIIEKKSKRKTG